MIQTSQELLEALRGSGFRVTLARRLVADVLTAAEEAHLTADDIFGRVSTLAPGIDRANVQRTLDALEEIGRVHHVHIGKGPGLYHLSDDHRHIHLVCESCDRTDVIALGPFLDTLTTAIDERDYKVTAFRLAVVGRCAECLATGRTPARTAGA